MFRGTLYISALCVGCVQFHSYKETYILSVYGLQQPPCPWAPPFTFTHHKIQAAMHTRCPNEA